MKVLNFIWSIILLVLAHSGPIADKSVEDGICKFSGQGRDEYGR